MSHNPENDIINHHNTEIKILESDISRLLVLIGEKRAKVDEHKYAIKEIKDKLVKEIYMEHMNKREI